MHYYLTANSIKSCITKVERYCHVPARLGLQQTTLAPGSDETRARDPLVR